MTRRCGSIPDLDTSRLKQLDAIRTDAPINLPVDTIPELVFKHDLSMVHQERMERLLKEIHVHDDPSETGS